MNLHHFLYVTARARLGLDAGRVAVASALADTAGFAGLSMRDQQGWQAVVAYYESTMARRDVLFDSGMITIDNRLALLDSASTVLGVGLDSALAEVLERAEPVYRHLWWPRHAMANARWEAGMTLLLAQHGDSLAVREARAFREPWPPKPVRVDVTAYANWAGAFTTTGPPHIIVSSTAAGNQDDQGLEILFHEVLHTMNDSLAAALVGAFRAQGTPLPRDVTHVFVFYTAGALTQREVAGHVPYAEKNGLWSRVPDFARALPVLQRAWQPYLDDKITFAEAVRRYAAAIQ